MTAALDQPWVILRDHNAKAAELKLAGELARKAVAELDSERDLEPEREARILAGIAGTSISEAHKELARLDGESADRALRRKIAVGLAAAIDERVRAIEAAEAAKDPAQRRREQEAAAREAQLQALFAKIPALFRTDFMISKLGAAAYSRTPPPQGSQVSYIRTFDVRRVLQHLMTETKLPAGRQGMANTR